jgi:ketosteroid isomerase-like protein
VKQRSESADIEGVVLAFNEAINGRNLERLTELMTEDHRLITGTAEPVVGKEACRRAWGQFFELCPDYQNVFEGIESEGSVVRIRGRSSSSDRRLSGPAIWAAVIEGRRVREWCVDEDTPEGWRRLGFDPPDPATPGSPDADWPERLGRE